MTVRVEHTADRQFGTNSYLVEDESTHDAVVIDANLEPQTMVELVRDRQVDVRQGSTELAHALFANDLVDAMSIFTVPVVLGGGTPFFPALDKPINLELVETRTFGSRVVYVRYRRVGDGR